MKFTGKAWRLRDNINTDLIIAGRYKYDNLNMAELAKHAFEDLDPTLRNKISRGDIIVAGENFGCGSSREQAPEVMKALGIQVIVAESVARIFFRNSLNIGLAAIECRGITSKVESGQIVEVNIEEGTITNLSTGESLKFKPWPEIMRRIFEAGGLVNYIKQGGEL